jgi:predicted metal-dependent peptidase
MSKINKRVAKGRIKLLLTQPFFGMLITKMGAVERADIGTMATDGTSLFFSPDFVERISEPEVLGVLCHEVLHVAYAHHLRRGKRQPRLWNIACDYAINLIVVGAGMKLPEGALLSDDYRGMSAEKIYDLLLKEQEGKDKPDQPGQGGGQGKIPEGDDWEIGGVLDKPGEEGKPLTGEALEDAIRQNEVSVSEAATAALAQGKLPLELRRLINDIAKGTVRWDEELQRIFASTFSADYTWSRPNRRHIGRGVYLPSTIKEGVGEVVIGVDTSGSISGPILDAFWSVVDDIIEQASPERVHIVWCDSRVQHTQTFEKGESLKPEARGGGGTDFRPVFKWVDDQGIEPQALIYITDMYGSFPTEAPDYPTIWVKTTDVEAPFGSEVRIEVGA